MHKCNKDLFYMTCTYIVQFLLLACSQEFSADNIQIVKVLILGLACDIQLTKVWHLGESHHDGQIDE